MWYYVARCTKQIIPKGNRVMIALSCMGEKPRSIGLAAVLELTITNG